MIIQEGSPSSLRWLNVDPDKHGCLPVLRTPVRTQKEGENENHFRFHTQSGSQYSRAEQHRRLKVLCMESYIFKKKKIATRICTARVFKSPVKLLSTGRTRQHLLRAHPISILYASAYRCSAACRLSPLFASTRGRYSRTVGVKHTHILLRAAPDIPSACNKHMRKISLRRGIYCLLNCMKHTITLMLRTCSPPLRETF